MKENSNEYYDLEERIVMLQMAIETLESEGCIETASMAKNKLQELLEEEKRMLAE